MTDPPFITTDRPLVSVVIPALNEVASVPYLLARLKDLVIANPDHEFELVLVDDGSTDGTADCLAASPAVAPVTVVRLARNFGSHYAISAGFEHARGECAIVLGADLQEPPTLVRAFLDDWRAGANVVWGIRRSRVAKNWTAELPSRLFSFLFSRYAGLKNYPPEGPSGVLVDRQGMNEVVKLQERNRNVLALIAWLGFTQTRVLYDQEVRRHGQSRWTRSKMIKLAVDSLLQFSSMPLRACSLMGLFVAGLGTVYASLLAIRSLMGVDTPSGWPTLLIVVLILGGMQLTMIGIMGEYLWRAVEETRSRPLFVVRDVRRTEPDGEARKDTVATGDGQLDRWIREQA